MNIDVIDNKLVELRDEYNAGQTQMQRLQLQLAELEKTLLRISGAIQGLEELKAEFTMNEESA
jgi:hypothetical protein